MKKFHKDRLKKLAEYLKTVKETEFNMLYFKLENCKTQACACGHACDILSFKRAGLYLESDYHDYFGVKVFSLRYEDLYNFEAAAKFFGITENESEFLFNPDKYDENEKLDTKTVSKRILNFVKSK